ncbi:hypothetical protein M011DRAFT_173908 [Sporormia fimetaria CBS 119925]|uniref:Uncharacterized protein n=1 Tax=Sporormia fimetaria CBS 119925 TaxID=1340428 RepID=A0A6A6VL59_9PLEO|nr:hypothetical protein M011DRAFT_173908 [Sporormia fimetaria CBS 119925]
MLPGSAIDNLAILARTMPNVKSLWFGGCYRARALGPSLFNAVLWAFERQINTDQFECLALNDDEATTRTWTQIQDQYARDLWYRQDNVPRYLRFDTSLLTRLNPPSQHCPSLRN